MSDRRRLPLARRRRDVGAEQPRHPAGFMPDDEYPEYGQCVHKVARGQGDGELFAQNHNGVYRSGDNGADVGRPSPTACPPTSASPSSPTRAGRVWCGSCRSPTPASASRRTPSCRCSAPTTPARTWRQQANGLPGHSYTCVLRDAASLDEADPVGVYLGTRNGDVFASADEGESFQRIATQLPDVLVVRAAQLA